MSRSNGKSSRLELQLNLSRVRGGPSTRAAADGESSSPSSTSPSPPSSCVSSDGEQKQSSSPEATSMVLVGCPRCLMYVMLSQEDPKCPKCKSTVLLDLHRDSSTNKTRRS